MKGAVFTIVKNEANFFPVWLEYYSRFFNQQDIFVIDNGTTDGSICEGCGYVPVKRLSQHCFDVKWLLDTVSQFQRTLFNWGYDFVLFAESDEIIVPVNKFESHLKNHPAVRCIAYEVIHTVEASIDWNLPLIQQRTHWVRMPVFDKPLLSTVPLNWEFGFHNCDMSPPIDEALLMIHLRRIDFDSCFKRLKERRLWQRPPEQAENMAWQWALPAENFKSWFFSETANMVKIPESYKNVI